MFDANVVVGFRLAVPSGNHLLVAAAQRNFGTRAPAVARVFAACSSGASGDFVVASRRVVVGEGGVAVRVLRGSRRYSGPRRHSRRCPLVREHLSMPMAR